MKRLARSLGACLAPFLSARDDLTLDGLTTDLVPGSTVALVGSSWVGKSTLINRLLGEEHARTGEVREHDETGKHTTTRRELVLTPGGVLLIDTPGMRELGLWDAEQGLKTAFADLSVSRASVASTIAPTAGNPAAPS